MASSYLAQYYNQGPKVRATSEQPQWYRFTFTLPAGVALVDADTISFAKFGAGQKILTYGLGCDASFASSCDDAGVLTLGGTVASTGVITGGTQIDASVEGDAIATADRSNLENIAVAHVSADGDVLRFTVGDLTTATTTGARKMTLSVLVAQQNSRSTDVDSVLNYTSQYTL